MTLHSDVLVGLSATPKWLPARWFYDKVGSELFEEITRLPEYYPTRAEREILDRRAADIIAAAGCDTLVELGSGSSEKTRLLLEALLAARTADAGARYVALDVSHDALHAACEALVSSYPQLSVEAIRADFTSQLHTLPTGGHKLVAFLGSTIGNLEAAEREAFFRSLHDVLRPGDHLLLGADLVKAREVLVPAYDDAAGVTAAFNLNLLNVLNDALAGDLNPEDFEHLAVWDAERERIEMRLRCRRTVRARFQAMTTTQQKPFAVDFEEGEEWRTEISTKFRRDSLAAELGSAGFGEVDWWEDAHRRFSLSLWVMMTQ